MTTRYPRIHDIQMGDRRLLRNLVDTNVVARVEQKLDDLLRPIRAVSEQTEVAQRLLGAAKLSFDLAQLI